MKNALIIAALFAAYVFVSNMDYEDAMLAHGHDCQQQQRAPQPANDTERAQV